MDKSIILIFTYISMAIVIIFGFGMLKGGLKKAGNGDKAYVWSIKGALSEKIDPPEKNGNGSDDPSLKPSFSRLCGAIGMIIMAAILLGVGIYGIWSLFENGGAAGIKDMGSLFLAGSALFAPYAFNQIKAAFQS